MTWETGFMRSLQRGVTLIELMVVMVVIAILAAVAVPAYRNYTMRANRTDATVALLRLAAAQEKFYMQNNTYTANLAAAPPLGLGIPNTEANLYQLAVANADANGFTATATALAGQLDDTDCRSFSIDQQGTKTAATAGGADNSAECWRR